MLGGRYRYEFFICWRAINASGAANYKDAYGSLAKVFFEGYYSQVVILSHDLSINYIFFESLDKVGDLLVGFFLESFENSFLLFVLNVRLGKHQTEGMQFIIFD